MHRGCVAHVAAGPDAACGSLGLALVYVRGVGETEREQGGGRWGGRGGGHDDCLSKLTVYALYQPHST